MEGSPSSIDEQSGLTARVLPALYLFIISVVAGVVVGHAAVTLIYRPKVLGWLDALAIPLVYAGYAAFKGHLRALEEHTEEEYLKALRKGASPYVITFITVASLASGLVTGGIYAVDNADRKQAEAEAAQAAVTVSLSPPAFRSLPPLTKQNVSNSPKPGLSAETNSQTKSTISNPPLILKSIVGDRNRRTALINNTVLGEGQSALIKVEGSSLKVKCLKIDDDKVTLEVVGMTNQVVLNL